MRRYIRADTPGATYFFTATLQDRRSTLLVDHVEVLRACVAEVKCRHPFAIEAMVVLPEHLHAIWRLPLDDAEYPLRWRLIKRAFTRRLHTAGLLCIDAASRRGADERSVWQRRYWEHQIRDDLDYARHVEYIHYNPVKHGLVRSAADWPYSSFHSFVRRGLVGGDWGMSAEVAGSYGE